MARKLSRELREFIESGVSILVGTRDSRLMPEAMRAMGVAVDPGGDEVRVFLPSAVAGPTVANLEDNGRIAVCLSRIEDHRSLQLKGRVRAIAPATEVEREQVERYRAAWAKSLAFVGLPPRLSYRVARWPCTAVRFTVESIFVQTPGPGAGDPLPVATDEAQRGS